MSALLLPLPDGESFADRLSRLASVPVGAVEWRRFPDGESYVRIGADCMGQHVVIVGSLNDPDARVLRLLFLADAARELGAVRVGLVAPYLSYLRQDARFRPGEAVTSRTLGGLLSSYVDWIATVDPHLHRYRSLSEIYRIPTHVLHAGPAIATWVAAHVPRPLLVGPDVESEQWVRAAAHLVGAPWISLRKTRLGDRSVEVSVPDVAAYRDRTPVLLDDIIASARTMVKTVQRMRTAGLRAPYCVGVHALLDDAAVQDLRNAGAADVVTSTSIPHPTNAIDIAPLVATALPSCLEATEPSRQSRQP
jgi:ribose-phosphate pyrophosphokinase